MPSPADRLPLGPRGRTAALGLLLVAAAAVVLGILACGREDEKVGEALDRAFAAPLDTAEVALDLELRVDGVPRLAQPARLRLRGPYRSGRSRTIPAFDWDVSLAGAGTTLAGRLVSTTDNLYVSFAGVAYEFGPGTVADTNRRIAASAGRGADTSLRDLGVDARTWIVDPQSEGEEIVAGEETTRYAAGLDLTRVLDDLNRVTEQAALEAGRPPPPPLTPEQRAEIRRIVRDPTFDVYLSEEDGGIRRLALRVPFAVPPERRGQASGATGGVASLSLQLARVGEPVDVSPPTDARPIEDLRRQLGPVPGAP